MKLRKSQNFVSQILCTLLIVVMALCITGCSDQKTQEPQNPVTQLTGGEIGEGSNQFTFIVVDQEKNTTEFEVHTNKEIVGEALQELNLIAGEMGDYGLYVKVVNGITVDYDKDGKYWAFYVNDSYAMSGVDTTPIVEGEVYSFKVE